MCLQAKFRECLAALPREKGGTERFRWCKRARARRRVCVHARKQHAMRVVRARWAELSGARQPRGARVDDRQRLPEIPVRT